MGGKRKLGREGGGGGGERRRRTLFRIVRARGAISKEVGPARCCVTSASNQSADEEDVVWNLIRAKRSLSTRLIEKARQIPVGRARRSQDCPAESYTPTREGGREGGREGEGGGMSESQASSTYFIATSFNRWLVGYGREFLSGTFVLTTVLS